LYLLEKGALFVSGYFLYVAIAIRGKSTAAIRAESGRVIGVAKTPIRVISGRRRGAWTIVTGWFGAEQRKKT
jgi:hypothetical protein